MKHITETKIGTTLFVITSECSPNAKETLEQKLERIISRHVSDILPSTNPQLGGGEKSLAMCKNLRLYGQ